MASYKNACGWYTYYWHSGVLGTIKPEVFHFTSTYVFSQASLVLGIKTSPLVNTQTHVTMNTIPITVTCLHLPFTLKMGEYLLKKLLLYEQQENIFSIF